MKIKIAEKVLKFKLKNPNNLFLNSLKRYSGFKSKEKANIFIETIFKKTLFNPNKPKIILNKKFLMIKRNDFSFKLEKNKGYLLINPSIYSFDSFLRVFYSYLLSKNNGILFHGASFSFKENAFLFLGKSGAGKSTISKLSSNKTKTLTDELTPLMIDKNKVYIYSSPFWGEMKGKGKYKKKELKKIFILKKSLRNKLIPVDKKDFIRLALSCSMNFNKTKENSLNLLNNLEKLYKLKKIYFLFFSNKNTDYLKLL